MLDGPGPRPRAHGPGDREPRTSPPAGPGVHLVPTDGPQPRLSPPDGHEALALAGVLGHQVHGLPGTEGHEPEQQGKHGGYRRPVGTTTVRRSQLDALLQRVQAAKGLTVEVGVLEAAVHRKPNGEPGPSIAQVLAWIEAGIGDTPSRPIIRWVVTAKRDEIRRHMRWVAHAIALGRDPAPELERLRAELEGWAKERMDAVGAVDSGQTRDAIAAAVRRVGAG